jgi:phosphatidate cytidylyltransferase
VSNLAQRVLTAIVAIPVILLVCVLGGWYFFILVAAASGAALYEFYGLVRARGASPNIPLGIVGGLFINLAFFSQRLFQALVAASGSEGFPFPSATQFLLITLLVAVLVISLVEMFRNKGSAIVNLSTTIFGMAYISLFFGTFIGIRELFTPLDFPIERFVAPPHAAITPDQIALIYQWGGYTVISIFAMIWICDTAAFHAGTVMGKHKLFPRVSPNKSWEGAVFGFVFALLTAAAAKYLVLPYLTYGQALVIGGIVGTFGQAGDLVESLLKRDAGVKDSSKLIPGHGGAFDRFDSLLFVAPLVYLYLDFVVFQ